MTSYNTVIAKQDVNPTVYVDRYTNGLIGPNVEWMGPVEDGGTIITETAPGCYGSMITPSFKGPHEVTRPVAVEGAEVGDAIAIRVDSIEIRSAATSTGTHKIREGAFGEDPGVDHKCPECGAKWPETFVKETGKDSIRCKNCGANASSYDFEFGYTTVFDEEYTVGLSVDSNVASELAEHAEEMMAIPEHAEQHPILLYKPSNIPGTLARLAPFIGHLGTAPPVTIPDSRNAGDLGQRLIGADHPWGINNHDDVSMFTDAHMDINELKEGAVLIAPVKIKGGGVYIGDLHANQGDGELAMHTTDVSGRVELSVNLLKGVGIEGPILLPIEDDIPDISKPFTSDELSTGRELAEKYDMSLQEPMAPIQFIGTDKTINLAVEDAFDRASSFLNMGIGEIRVRSTFTGGVSVGRLPGVVQLSMLLPLSKLDDRDFRSVVERHYQL